MSTPAKKLELVVERIVMASIDKVASDKNAGAT